MAESREERMQQRMRGAGRHEVADESFGFVLPDEDDAAAPAAVPAQARARSTTPATSSSSVKRRRLNPPASSRSSQPTRPRPQTISGEKPDPYNLARSTTPRAAQRLSAAARGEVEDEDALESLPQSVPRPSPRGSRASQPVATQTTEEVAESPANAPGSGQRRRIRAASLAERSAMLQKVVLGSDVAPVGEPSTSSPLVGKVQRRSTTTPAAAARAGAKTARSETNAPDEDDDVDELSPPVRLPRKSDSTADGSSARSDRSSLQRSALGAADSVPDELSSPAPLVESRRKAQAQRKAGSSLSGNKPTASRYAKHESSAQKKPTTQQQRASPGPSSERQTGSRAEAEPAEEIGAREAAAVIGRKRPRPRSPAVTPADRDEESVKSNRPAKKRQVPRGRGSPAKQSHPKPQKARAKKADKQAVRVEPITITVQRFTRISNQGEDDSEEDILAADIPFANRSGVNVVDMLMEMCDENIEATLERLHQVSADAGTPALKSEYKTKTRALQAFQEELRTRLLEHTAALDNMHSLRERVRTVQKEKLGLRDEIIRIRAEREQVALKIDAVRTKHEEESKISMHQLSLSSGMDDIELAVEKGRSATELTAQEQKAADLTNLQFLVSSVASQACFGGDGSGNLRQLQDFNALLERAAAVLEGS